MFLVHLGQYNLTKYSIKTLSTISFCLLSLLDNPNIVKIAQEELDSITDCNRLPNFQDETLTPYLGAVIKEVLRYWSVVPLGKINRLFSLRPSILPWILGVPHLTHTEDDYNGFRIPAESMILPNAWSVFAVIIFVKRYLCNLWSLSGQCFTMRMCFQILSRSSQTGFLGSILNETAISMRYLDLGGGVSISLILTICLSDDEESILDLSRQIHGHSNHLDCNGHCVIDL